MEEATKKPSTPKRGRVSPTAIAVFIFILVTALFLGVVVTTVKDVRLQQVSERLLNQQQALQMQVEQLQERLAAAIQYGSKTPTLLTTLATSTGRTLLSPEQIGIEMAASLDRCKEPLNAEPANTTVLFSSSKYGLSVQIPYSAGWAEPKYRLSPYDLILNEGDPAVAYGPVVPFENCAWLRTQYLRMIPPRSEQAAISSAGREGATKTTTESVNGLRIVRYVVDGLCAYPTLEILGKKYNYVLQPLCGGDEAKDFQELEAVAKTVRLVE